MCKFIKTILGLTLVTSSAFAAISIDPNLVRPWNKNEKNQFPTPLTAIFKKEDKKLIFVGDHHVDQLQTFRYLDEAIKKYTPDIIVIENLDFSKGENPKKWMDNFVLMSKEDLLKASGANAMATKMAFTNKIPLIGGEPSIDESMQSSFILSKGFDKDDILNVQVLQRIPYRRDALKITDPDIFFDYAIDLYKIKESKNIYKSKFLTWYKKRTSKEFNYLTVTKAETEVNCLPEDTFLQSVACAFNVNRDRSIVVNIETLLKSHSRVMVVYGTGHFVQEYPAFLKAFGQAPEYLKLGN